MALKQENVINPEITVSSTDMPEGGTKKPVRFWKKFLRFACMAAAVSIALELFVFNYASFALVGGKYKARYFDLSNAEITGMMKYGQDAGVYKAVSNEATVQISGIGDKVRTIYVNASSQKQNRYELCVKIAFTDAGHATLHTSAKEIRIVPEISHTRFAICSYSGKTDMLLLTFQTEYGETLTIRNIGVNYAVPFSISFLRIFLLILIACSIYVLLKAPSLKLAYHPDNAAQGAVLYASVVVFIVLLTIIYSLYSGLSQNTFRMTSGDQVSQELVDAFEHGQVSLLDKPSAGLLAMENPYDYSARSIQGVNFKWDHLLYNGKYYSYYGIAPVLLLFLPYHLLTGYYLPSEIGCFMFSMIGVLFLISAYLSLIRNWLKKTPFRLVLCGMMLLLFSCGILFCICRPAFYEAEEASGFMFLAAGVYMMFESGICTNRKILLSRLALSALCVSLAVLSRPTLSLYAVALLFWIGYGLIQYHREHPGKAVAMRYLTAALLPYILLGGVQMAYNYLRFGSVFDFGIEYSLTVTDCYHATFYASFALVSLWNMMLALPVTRTAFPFIGNNIQTFGMNGYYFFETGITYGLLWRVLPLLSIPYAPHVLRRFDRGTRIKTLLLCALPGLIIPLVIICCTWQSGYALRYNVDFAWPMVLLALFIVFYVYTHIENEGVKRILSLLMIGCTVYGVLADLATMLEYIPGVTQAAYSNPEMTLLYYRFGRLFEFWS